MKMKHIIALCLVLTLLMSSTAFAATGKDTTAQSKLSIKVLKTGDKKVTVSYSYSGPAEKIHTWNFGDGFSCHCKSRTHTYKNHGKYRISMNLVTQTGKTVSAYRYITV